MKVIKRDGRVVLFNRDKIRNAVLSAFSEVDGEESTYAKNKANEICLYIESMDKDMTVEEIQDLVEKKLMDSNRKDVAKAYIIYRNQRTTERNKRSKLTKDIKRRINASNVENQNANVDEKSFGGKMGSVTSDVLKDYALNNCMSEMAKNNHLNNEIYIHDLDSYAVGEHNCLSIPFDDLLAKGFTTRQTDVRPANSVNTAFQLVAVIFQLQSLQQFGGVSATHLDWTMVPYVRKSFYKHYFDGMRYIGKLNDEEIEWQKNNDMNFNPGEVSIEDKNKYRHEEEYAYALKMTEKEVYQGAEGLYHNLNTLQSRSGNQLPFTSINYGTCTSEEGRMVTKALLSVSIEGIGALHRTPIFPCGIFQCMKGVNRKPGDPNYDLFKLALKSTAQRLYPNYANADVSFQKDWVAYDRKCKEEVINNLSKEEYLKLIDRLDKNPELKHILMLDVIEE